MALLDSKQLNPRLTGSFTLSGSIAGDSASTGSFGRLQITGNSDLTGNLTLGGNITIGESSSDSISITAHLTSNLTPNAGSTYDLGNISKTWRKGYIEELYPTTITATGNVSSSAASTGSFGTLQTAGNINASGRIYEAGSSVIDHATAMAIVFRG